tara:strand:+ start:171 stop:803 length:633 start_codon:yes stop_codon:yes gene_type:complete
MAYGKILQHALQAGRNLGQAGKNYGRIARDRGADLLRNNPEYIGAAGLTGAIGGAIAHDVSETNEQKRIKQYQGVRQLIKNETGGLGGLVYNKKKDHYVVTYSGSPKDLKEKKHFHALKYIIDNTNDKLDIKMKTAIHALSSKRSDQHKKQIEKMLSTPEGAKELENYLMESEKTMQNPYSDDYRAARNVPNPFMQGLPQGDTMGTGDFR